MYPLVVRKTEIREEIKTELGEEIETEMGEEIKTEMEEEIQAEMGEETSSEMRDLEETMGSTTQQREDDSPSTSTESTRRIPPLQKNSELPGKSCNILAAPTNATFCCNIYPHQDM